MGFKMNKQDLALLVKSGALEPDDSIFEREEFKGNVIGCIALFCLMVILLAFTGCAEPSERNLVCVSKYQEVVWKMTPHGTKFPEMVEICTEWR